MGMGMIGDPPVPGPVVGAAAGRGPVCDADGRARHDAHPAALLTGARGEASWSGTAAGPSGHSPGWRYLVTAIALIRYAAAFRYLNGFQAPGL
ncbi:hypothetical protein GCM10010430_04160 [Kitasatospora cystarginea]|uniref:Uncharacterized protein n=1 Tax=Kitasatospora cystarginea TaxID=58350 RepID=A0ABP5Q743_9ACTN